MTPEHAAALAECDRLRLRITELERRLGELDPPRPRLTSYDLCPRQAREV